MSWSATSSAAPATAQIASGQLKGRRITPIVATAAMIQIACCGVMPMVCSASMDQAVERRLVSCVLDRANSKHRGADLWEPSRDLRVRAAGKPPPSARQSEQECATERGGRGEEPHMGLSCNGAGLLDQVSSFVATISIAELLFFTVPMLETHCVGKTSGNRPSPPHKVGRGA